MAEVEESPDHYEGVEFEAPAEAALADNEVTAEEQEPVPDNAPEAAKAAPFVFGSVAAQQDVSTDGNTQDDGQGAAVIEEQPQNSSSNKAATTASPVLDGPAGQIGKTFVDELKTQDSKTFAAPSFQGQKNAGASLGNYPDNALPGRRSAPQPNLPDLGRRSALRATYPPATHQRSQLGPQAESVKRSAPRMVIGSSERFEQRTYISKEHSKVLMPPNNPGPGTYNLQGRFLRGRSPTKVVELPSIGGTRSRGVPDVPEPPFAITEPRFHMQNVRNRVASEIPGPGEYRVNTPQRFTSNCHNLVPVGFAKAERRRQPAKGFEAEFLCTLSPGPIYLPNHAPVARHHPSAGFGNGERKEDTRWAQQVPGPGAYQIEAHVDSVHGHKAIARRADAGLVGGNMGAGAKFTTDTRDKAAKASLLPSQAVKLLAGRAHPDGPAAYNITREKVDRLSRAKHAPSFPFGTTGRFPTIKGSGAPGPGSYCV